MTILTYTRTDNIGKEVRNTYLDSKGELTQYNLVSVLSETLFDYNGKTLLVVRRSVREEFGKIESWMRVIGYALISVPNEPLELPEKVSVQSIEDLNEQKMIRRFLNEKTGLQEAILF